MYRVCLQEGEKVLTTQYTYKHKKLIKIIDEIIYHLLLNDDPELILQFEQLNILLNDLKYKSERINAQAFIGTAAYGQKLFITVHTIDN